MNKDDWEWLKARLRDLETSAPVIRIGASVHPIREDVARQRPDLLSLFDIMIEELHSTEGTQTLNPPGGPFRPGDTISNRYRIVATVGEGGMGCVYEVEDQRLTARGSIALKTIRAELARDPDNVARFEREVRHALSVTHPNVCRTYDMGWHGEGEAATLYLTMEFLAGRRLDRWLKDQNGANGVPEDKALPLIRQMAAGLTAIHDRNIVHRDFKPANVMVMNGGDLRAVITDLGLARASESGIDPTVTRVGAAPGTRAYMPPELLRGEGPATCAADVYSLGITMLEMLTGRYTLAERPEQALLTRGVSPWLRAVVAKCLEPELANRYVSGGEVLRALEPHSLPPQDRGKGVRRKWVSAAAIVAVASLGGIAVVQLAKPAIPARALELTTSGAEKLFNNSFLDASRILEQAAALGPHYALARAMLADSYNELDLTGRANREMNAIASSDLGSAKSDERIYIEGVRLSLTRDYEGAVRQFRQYYDKADQSSKPNRAILLGRALEKAQRNGEAMQAYREAGTRGAAVLSLAVLHAKQQNVAQALAGFEAARRQFASLAEHGSIAGLEYQLGAAYNRWDKLPEAESAFHSCVEQTGVTGDVYDALRCRLQLGTISLRRARLEDDFKAVERDLLTIVEEAARQGFQVLQARAWVSLGQAYVVAGDFGQAEHSFSEASLRADAEQSARVKAAISMAQADLHHRTRRLQLCEREAADAALFYKQDGALRELSQALLLEGRALRDDRHLGEALKKFTDEREVASKVSPGEEAKGWESIGTIYQDQENYPAAVGQYRHALKLGGSELDIVYYRVDLAGALAELGQWREAREVLDPLRPDQLPADPRASMVIDLAEIALVSGNPELVRLELVHAAQNETDLELLGAADLLTGDFRNARTECGTALAKAGEEKGDQNVSTSSLCAAEASLLLGDARSSLDILASAETQWSAHPVERFRGLALRSATLRALGRSGESKVSRETAMSAMTDLIGLWGPADFQSWRSRADVRRDRIMSKFDFK